MRTVPAGLATHLAGEVLSIAHCWKITRADAQVFGFTDHDADITLAGVLYQPDAGFASAAIEAASGLQVGNAELAGAFVSALFTEPDLAARKWDRARVDAYLCCWADPSLGSIQMGRGWLGEATVRDGSFTIEFLSLAESLQRPVGRVLTAACPWTLGDAQCGINLATFGNGTLAGTVSSVTSAQVFRASGLAGLGADWLTAGKLTWTAGANAGVVEDIKSYDTANGDITLQIPASVTPTAGDTFTALVGCNKTLEQCRVRFSNQPRFGGFPHVIGRTRLRSGT